jgi:hypothetical protein
MMCRPRAAAARPSSTGCRCCRPTAALQVPPGRLHHRRGAARGPGRAAGGADAALPVPVARRRLAASHRDPYLPAWGLLARGGLPPADVGPARHGGHRDAARRAGGHVRLPLGASLSGSRSRGCPRPATSSPPALTLGLVCGSSLLAGPARVVPGPGRATAAAAGNAGSPDLKAIEQRKTTGRVQVNKRFATVTVSIWSPRLLNSRAHFPSMQIRRVICQFHQ